MSLDAIWSQDERSLYLKHRDWSVTSSQASPGRGIRHHYQHPPHKQASRIFLFSGFNLETPGPFGYEVIAHSRDSVTNWVASSFGDMLPQHASAMLLEV